MSKPSLLRRFFGGIWKTLTWIRLGLANVLFLAMLAVIYFVYFGGTPEPLPQKAALLFNPVGSIVDQKQPVDPLFALSGEQSPEDREVLLQDVIDSIEAAAGDPAINSMVMELGGLRGVGISRSGEIGTALEAFKATGKPVAAYADFYTQNQYLLASYADEIIAHPMGGVALEGFGSYHNYYLEALEKLAVNMHVFRRGKYKSAVEPYLRNDMSPPEKEVNRAWLDDLWGRYTAQVEERRELETGAVNAFINGMTDRMVAGNGDSASDALDAGLVDQLLARSAVNNWLAEMVGATDEDGYFESVGFEYYLSRKGPVSDDGEVEGRVAVITAQGNILPGEQPPGTIGSDSLAWLISDTVSSGDADAIVLRISSGGGSMFASEIIRERVLEARAKGIPVVVSMGAVAASGGYYIAANADEIWATPTTITGSIGVIAAFPTLEGTLAKLGIHTDGVGTTDLAGSLRLDRTPSPELKASVDAGVGYAYDSFLEVVAEGRSMSLEETREVAEGRVWSADAALANGLVDYLGSLDDAIASAAAIAELGVYEIEYVKPHLSPQELFWQQLSERVELPAVISQSGTVAALQSLTRPVLQAVSEVYSLQDPRNMFYKCLDCSVVE
ncbi:signal peptide peptidase SppA [Halioglobus maricola]|uniref:Signal peptide peptidase SppA n=1 Tax=Halioglobus maricola TaxID=2601894 RepID=A0A5P9NI88_9GAMM|nr:signal peptide peptidase SppA [Halioglobus maricola]QFU74904.1 signal peptide peptidase SppA [Halioglobus maricola]